MNLKEVLFTGPRDPRHERLLVAEPGIKVELGVPTMMEIDGIPAMITRGLDDNDQNVGQTVYLNLLLTSYLSDRLDDPAHELRSELLGLLRLAGVRPIARLQYHGDNWLPVRLHLRQDADRLYLGVIANWRTSTVSCDGAGLVSREPLSLEVLLPRAGRVSDLLTGKAVAGTAESSGARVSRIRFELPVHEARVFRIDP